MDPSARRRPGRLRRWTRIVARRHVVIELAVVSAIAAACALMLLRDPVYRGEATVLVRPLGAAEREEGTWGAHAAAVIEGDEVRFRVAQLLGRADLPRVEAVERGGEGVVVVRVEAADADTAAAYANAYANAYVQAREVELAQAREELRAELVSALGGEGDVEAVVGELWAQLSAPSARVADAARPPDRPLSPTPARTVLLALAGGLLLGLLAVPVVHRVDDTIRSPVDLARVPFPLLAVVVDDPVTGKRPANLRRRADPNAVVYERLAANLDARAERVVQVTSLGAGHGASTVAVYLGAAFAMLGRETLLMDADLRHPDLHRLLAVDGSFGLVDNLGGESLDMTVLPVRDQLTFLAAGDVRSDPIPLLSTRRLESLVEEARERYERVVVNSTPMPEHGDALFLSRLTDGVVVVVRTGTAVRAVQEAVERLDRAGTTVIGVVLNRAAG